MSDNKTKVRPQDSTRVNINEDYEVQYWTEKFGCSREQLKKAVNAVGVSAKAVQDWLQKNK